ncbi:MAG TPA: polysaccharide biosynthesis tyrosine autokinase [Dinghuibacter sp.]|uniref:GumC family protein n=1 Tax=Dinghuibacter sp. TaxID=2024697 RepID=UPI002C1DFB6B|nr:polysaccharide biosynthesis tyrosine autokinase [Dinghuibacter sp.]HTJ11373.1 polysaccharide biosynthesis tyrosine autokinase [Dinghuibacter sp.]
MQINNKAQISNEEENAFSQLFHKYFPYWPLFLSLLVVTVVVAKLYIHWAIPYYDVTAQVMVKDQKNGVDDQNLMEQLDLFGSKKFVENEIEIIHSRMLMRLVVKDLSLYAPIMYQGRIANIPAYVLSPVIIQVANPDSIEEQKSVLFSFDSAHQRVLMGKESFAVGQWFTMGHYTRVRFVANPNYQAPSVQKPLSFSLITVKAMAEGILKGLKTGQSSKMSSVINLTLRDAVPKRGEDILNDLIRVYQTASITDKNTLAANTLKFIDGRLVHVTQELNAVERGIQDYKTTNGIVDVSAQGQLYLDNVEANDQKQSEINVQLAVMDQVEQFVRSNDTKSDVSPSAFGVSDIVLAGLLQQLYSLQVQYDGLKKTTGENNPMLLTLKAQIDKMKPGILQSVQAQRQNLEASKAALSHTGDAYSSVLKTLPEKERGLIAISRDQTVKNSIYAFLLQKREETALSLYSQVSDTRLVDDAEATVLPVSPQHLMVYAIAIILAFAVGAGFIALREVLNPNIVFRKEIEQYTDVPIIGEIMYQGSGSPLITLEDTRSIIAEQFRILRTTLAYIGINNRKKRVLVTSSISGEGKSFVTANLGLALAMAGKKVILLESDLRKPKLSAMFGVTRESGLTNLLVGDREPDEIIRSTSAHQNLFLIPSGPIPPNPSELIMNGRFTELLDYLQGHFDFIIIDSAPVGPVTDSYIISSMVDATLYIVRHGVTPKTFIKKLENNNRIHPLKNLAIIFNGVKTRGFGNYGYGYGYGNGYGYGYAENGKTGSKKKKNEQHV